MSEQINTNQTNEEQKPLGVLFGILAYNTDEELEEFFNRLHNKSIHDVLITINSALRYAQLSGVFSVEESEAISISLRKLKPIFIPEE